MRMIAYPPVEEVRIHHGPRIVKGIRQGYPPHAGRLNDWSIDYSASMAFTKIVKSTQLMWDDLDTKPLRAPVPASVETLAGVRRVQWDQTRGAYYMRVAGDLNLHIYHQLPEQVRDRVEISSETDPFCLYPIAVIKFKGLSGTDEEMRLTLQFVEAEGMKIYSRISEEDMAKLCVAVP